MTTKVIIQGRDSECWDQVYEENGETVITEGMTERTEVRTEDFRRKCVDILFRLVQCTTKFRGKVSPILSSRDPVVSTGPIGPVGWRGPQKRDQGVLLHVRG